MCQEGRGEEGAGSGKSRAEVSRAGPEGEKAKGRVRGGSSERGSHGGGVSGGTG